MLNSLTPVQKLERIRGLLNHPAIDHTDVARRFRDLLKDVGYRKQLYIIHPSALSRATCHSEELWFDNVSKLSYPPREVLIKKGGFGRCNWPAEPVFYCSNETGVPVFEVRPSIGTYVVLSRWEGKSSGRIELYGVALGVEAIIGCLSEDDEFLLTLQKDDLFKEDTPQAVKDINRYVAKLFIEDASVNKNTYQLTSSVAKVHFDDLILESNSKKVDALLYPSVASQLTGYNVALTTDFVETNLRPKGARMFQVIDFNEEALEYKLKPTKRVKGAYPTTGELVWEYVHKDISDQIWTLSPQSPSILI